MKRHKIPEIVAVVVFLAVVGLLVGWPRGAKPPKVDDSLKRVMAAKKLVVGMTFTYRPMAFRAPKGEPMGFDVEMGRAICDRLGLEFAIKQINWDEKYDALNEGKIDCLCEGIAVTPERMQKVDFPAPYLFNELVFVANRDSGFKEVQDLTGAKVGVLGESTADEAIRDSGFAADLKIVKYDDNDAVFDKLQAGEINAALTDSVAVFYYMTIKKRPLLILPGRLRKEQLAIAFRKGDQALRDKVQAVVEGLKADGTLAKISVKWFGTNLVP